MILLMCYRFLTFVFLFHADDTLLRSSVPNKLALSAATLSSSVELSATDNKESSSENARLLKSQKAREMLSRLKASKAVNKESVDNN